MGKWPKLWILARLPSGEMSLGYWRRGPRKGSLYDVKTPYRMLDNPPSALLEEAISMMDDFIVGLLPPYTDTEFQERKLGLKPGITWVSRTYQREWHGFQVPDNPLPLESMVAMVIEPELVSRLNSLLSKVSPC